MLIADISALTLLFLRFLADLANERAIFLGSDHVNTPGSNINALLSLVTLVDQFLDMMTKIEQLYIKIDIS